MVYETNHKTLRKIMMDYALHSKFFLRFLKENNCFTSFFKATRKMLLFHNINDDDIINFNDLDVLRDVVFYSIPLINGWEQIDDKWMHIVLKKVDIDFEKETQIILEIAEKKYGLICRQQKT